MTVVIVASKGDPATAQVGHLLADEHGIPPLILDPADGAQGVTGFHVSDANGEDAAITASNQTVHLRDVTVIWFQHAPIFLPDIAAGSFHQALHSAQELRHFFLALPYLAPKALVEKHVLHTIRCALKPLQLSVARRVGFRLPPTFTGNDVGRLSAFLRDNCEKDARIVMKAAQHCGPQGRAIAESLCFFDGVMARLEHVGPEASGVQSCVAGIASRYLGEPYWDPAVRLSRTEVQASFPRIRSRPATIQQPIDKKCDVRVIVIGSSIHACGIFSTADHVDFRVGQARHEFQPLALSSPDRERILAFMREMDCQTGCLDFAMGQDGTLHFLEFNPDGHWYWIEQYSGMPLCRAYADWIATEHRKRL